MRSGKGSAFQGAHGTSILGAVANLAAYQEGFGWLEEVIPYLDRNRRALAELVETHMPGVKCCPGEGTYVGWLDFNALDLPASPAAFFQEHANVRLTEGKNCGQGFENFARFIFATPPANHGVGNRKDGAGPAKAKAPLDFPTGMNRAPRCLVLVLSD